MIYDNIKKGKFISRPNRFIANIEIDGKEEICHVKNTGRCRELLISGASVFVQKSEKAERKTGFDLISVYKGDTLVNIDSQAPNKVVGEWLTGYFQSIRLIKPEAKYKNSRFDYYIETDKKKIILEVKGVTLEKDGVALFPDAPTLRGVKHINELIKAKECGYSAYILFVVQMKGVHTFSPNKQTHQEFAKALKEAYDKGVNILVYDCTVTPDSLKIDSKIKRIIFN